MVPAARMLSLFNTCRSDIEENQFSKYTSLCDQSGILCNIIKDKARTDFPPPYFALKQGYKNVNVFIIRTGYKIFVTKSNCFGSVTLLTTIFSSVWYRLLIIRVDGLCVKETKLLEKFITCIVKFPYFSNFFPYYLNYHCLQNEYTA